MEMLPLTITPLDDKVVIELPQSVNANDQSNLIQLLRHQDKVVYSTIVAVGPGKTLSNGTKVPMLYEVGQQVFFPAECERTSPRIKVDGTEYMILIQEQVLCYRAAATQVE